MTVDKKKDELRFLNAIHQRFITSLYRESVSLTEGRGAYAHT